MQDAIVKENVFKVERWYAHGKENGVNGNLLKINAFKPMYLHLISISFVTKNTCIFNFFNKRQNKGKNSYTTPS